MGFVGLVRYGTIGHGDAAADAGVALAPRPSEPAVTTGQPNVQGDLDRAIIRRYIKRNIQKIALLRARAAREPSLAGTVTTNS